MGADPGIERRSFLWLGAGSVLAACGTHSDLGTVATPSGPTALPSSIPAPQASLPRLVPWRARPGEEQPAAKIAAVRDIERGGNTPGHRLQVIDAQYGGLLSDAASVLVACESWSIDGSRLVAGGHTFDVRVRRSGGRWQVTEILASSPGPPAARASAAARRVLATTRISLPPAARADVESGQVHDSVLEAMLSVSLRWRIAVSVIRSGHPQYVFGTSRLSDHPRGRAFDTWAIDGIPVVAAGPPNPAVPAYMEALASAGSYNVGGPLLLGSAPQFFSDATHHDHVHAGFSA